MNNFVILLSLSSLTTLSRYTVTNNHSKLRGACLTFNANTQNLIVVKASPLAEWKSGAKEYALISVTQFCHE